MERAMNVFETRTVSELLFEGWSTPEFNFNFAQSGIPRFENITFNGTLVEILYQAGLIDEIPDEFVNTTIGYFSVVS